MQIRHIHSSTFFFIVRMSVSFLGGIDSVLFVVAVLIIPSSNFCEKINGWFTGI